jgi:hypothetical protein
MRNTNTAFWFSGTQHGLNSGLGNITIRERNMHEINLIDPALKNIDDTFELSIQVGPQGFSFCIHSPVDQQIKVLRHYPFVDIILEEDLLNNTSEILRKDELLRLHYRRVWVIYFGRKSTIVPNAFISEDNLKKILEFNQPLDELDEIHQNVLRGCDSQLIFAIPTYFAGIMSEKFRDARFFSQATPLLTHVLKRNQELEANRVYIQLNKDFFDMVIIQDRKLTLYNSFLFVNSTDLLYFVLYVCKQLKIETKSTVFILFGERSAEAALLKELKAYLPRLFPDERNGTLPADKLLKPAFQQRFFSLIHLHQCE